MKKIIAVMSLLLLLILSGCSMSTGDDLLALPKLPEEYVKLQEKLDRIIAQGASYAVAESGTNRQAVQFTDLDGDGNEEAVALFRAESGLYQIYVFRESEGDYILSGHAEGAGAYINSINYVPRDDKGRSAIAVGWAFDDVSSYGLTVFDITAEGLIPILEKQYSFMLTEDITEDSVSEFMIVSWDSISENFCLEIYEFNGQGISLRCSSSLCKEIRSVVKILCGKVGMNPAVYVDSLAAGGGYVTDMITVSGEQAVNNTVDSATGSGMVTWRSLSVTCEDIDGDGVIEIPSSYDTTVESTGADLNNKLSWDTYSLGAREKNHAVTFHNPSENWYILWPEEWDEDVHAGRTTFSTMTSVNFYIMRSDLGGIVSPEGETSSDSQHPVDVAGIYVLNNDSRLDYMLKQGMKIIRQSNGQIIGYIIRETEENMDFIPEDFASLIRIIENNWTN